MTQISTRPAALADTSALAAIHVAAYEEAYRGLLPDAVIDERTEEVRRASWERRLASPAPREFVLVAEVDGRVAGFVSGRPARPEEDDDPARVACLENIYAAPEYLGSGIGKVLHDATLKAAAERGFSEVILFVFEANDRARGFFDGRGWTPDGGRRVTDDVAAVRLRHGANQGNSRTPTKSRTRAEIEREYGETRWPAIERVIAEERDADPEAGFGRILGRVSAHQWATGDPSEPRPVVIDGAGTRLPLSGAFAGAQGIILEYLRDACTPETDLIVELGSGWGWHILSCWAQGGPTAARYVAAEYTEAGRRASSALAALEPALDFTAHPFDYHEPSFDGVEPGRHAVVFTVHSLEQIPYVRPTLFEAIVGMAERVTCLHFEPVGWQTEGYSGTGTSGAFSQSHDYNRNLVQTVQEQAAEGILTVDLIQPDVIGINPSNSTTVMRWRSPAG